MDGYQFVAALVQSVVSLAWPAVVGLIAWSYKENILALLQRMNGTVKGFGLEFSLAAAGQTAKAVDKEVATAQALPPAIASDVPAASADTQRDDAVSKLPTPIGDEVPASATATLRETENSKPLSAQPVSWTLQEIADFVPAEVFSESMARIKEQLLDIFKDSGSPQTGPALPRLMARELVSAGVLDWKTAKLIAQLADIARASRHTEPTSEQANQFLSMADSVRKSLNAVRMALKLKSIAHARPPRAQ